MIKKLNLQLYKYVLNFVLIGYYIKLINFSTVSASLGSKAIDAITCV